MFSSTFIKPTELWNVLFVFSRLSSQIPQSHKLRNVCADSLEPTNLGRMYCVLTGNEVLWGTGKLSRGRRVGILDTLRAIQGQVTVNKTFILCSKCVSGHVASFFYEEAGSKQRRLCRPSNLVRATCDLR